MYYVYVFSIETGLAKIGRTADPKRRLGRLAETGAYELTIEKLWETQTLAIAVAAEKELHQRFDKRRARGEWFKLQPEDWKWLRNDPKLSAPVRAIDAAPDVTKTDRREFLIQIRASAEEKRIFHRHGGSRTFRVWLRQFDLGGIQ